MSGFEFVFSLFGLLLGLCIAEIFGGLGRVFERRRDVQLGPLTPLLGLIVLADLVSWWGDLWDERARVPMNPLTLFAGVVFGGAYYLAAYVVFPKELKQHADLNSHFFAVRRLILGISATAFFGVLLLQHFVTKTVDLDDLWLTAGLFAPLYLIAIASRKRHLVAMALALIVALNFVGAATHVFIPD